MRVVFALALWFFVLTSQVGAAVIYETTFDSITDWTVTQSTSADTSCSYDCGTEPENAWGYRNGFSYCTGGPGSNNIYIHQYAGYPSETNGCYGGSGKCETHWTESCTNTFEDSDGYTMYSLGGSTSEFYVGFWIRFKSNFQFESDDSNPPAHKIFRAQYNCGSGNPYAYRGQTNYDCQKPFVMSGFYVYGGHLYFYFNAACEQDCLDSGSCCSPYSWDGGSGWDSLDFVDMGTLTTLRSVGTGHILDGNWHYMSFYVKANTNTGSTFHNDGVFTFRVDDQQVYTVTTFPYGQTGGDTSPRRYFNLVGIGGNNSNRWTSSCSGTSCEQWWTVDNMVISTDYKDSSYTIGGGSDTTPPTVTFTTASPQRILVDSLAISGTATDDVGVTSCKYRVGSRPDASNGTALSGTTSWSGTATGFSYGANILWVGCTDAAANWDSSGSYAKSITVDYVPHIIGITGQFSVK